MTPRARDLLQTCVLVLIFLTPAWLLPTPVAAAWLLLTAAIAGPSLWFTWHGAPWVPTPPADLPRVTEALGVGPGDRVVDLGAGEGRVLRYVARHTGAQATGIEGAVLPWLVGRLRRTPSGVTLIRGDRYHPSAAARLGLASADAVYLWSTEVGVAHPALPALLARLPEGARVVCYSTPLPFATPSHTDASGTRQVYVYTAPVSSSDKHATA